MIASLVLIALVSCPFPFDDLVTGFGDNAIVLPREDVPDAATRGFIANLPDGSIVMGLEIDGCTAPPIVIVPAPNLSGRNPATGKIGA